MPALFGHYGIGCTEYRTTKLIIHPRACALAGKITKAVLEIESLSWADSESLAIGCLDVVCVRCLLLIASTMAWSVTAAEAMGALVATLVMLYFLAQARQRKSLPPGPRPWPVVGNLPLLAFGGQPHRSLEKLASKYGGIMYLRLGVY